MKVQLLLILLTLFSFGAHSSTLTIDNNLELLVINGEKK